LLAAFPLGAVLWRWHRRRSLVLSDRRLKFRLAFRSLALAMLLLAMAGLRVPGQGQPIQIVAAVDLSASVYDKDAQAPALAELPRALAHEDLEIGVVTFGRRTGHERRLAPVPGLEANRAPGSRETPTAPGAPSLPPWPNLRQPQAAIDPKTTDLGAAIEFFRGQFPADRTAALAGGEIDLLAWPSVLGACADVHVAEVRLPERARVGRGILIDVSVEGQSPGKVQVRVSRRIGSEFRTVGQQALTLEDAPQAATDARVCRGTARIVDRPEQPGVVVYEARVEGIDREPLPDNNRENDALYAAARVTGPSRCAVLACPGSTLAQWAADASGKPLGVETVLFPAGAFPHAEGAYAGCSGVLVNGISARELPADSKALVAAVRGGLGLVAIGGGEAFGAGGHPEDGEWERLLPATLRPEDDRTRTVLFVLDISRSMDQRLQEGGAKLAFARAQLGRAVRSLRPTDRLGLIVFSDASRVVCPVSTDPARAEFLQALHGLATENQTDIRAALKLARETLEQDEAEERKAVFISDGEQTPARPEEELLGQSRLLCPPPERIGARRRTTLHTFGIGTGTRDANPAGEKLMKDLAEVGGCEFFPDFLKLSERIEKVFYETREDLYTRRDEFGAQAAGLHPILSAAGGPWPALSFRNRVKPRAGSETLLRSVGRDATEKGARRPDPLLVLGHCGAARMAVLALALDSEPGQAFLAPNGPWKGWRALLAALLSWAEGDENPERRGWRLEAGPAGDRLQATLFAEDPALHTATNGLELTARLSSVGGLCEGDDEGGRIQGRETPFLPVAPGRYAAELPVPPKGVYRLEVLEKGAVALERFVTSPYPQELRRFGTDRTALNDLARLAGGRSRMIDLPRRDLAEWRAQAGERREYHSARTVLLVLAAIFFLCEIAARGMRRERGGNVLLSKALVSRRARRAIQAVACLSCGLGWSGEEPMARNPPPFSSGEPAPGKFVKQTAEEYAGTEVYHGLYLPSDWRKGGLYPVLVEYAGNQFGAICTGKVDDCRLGFGLSGGKGFIWLVLPYVNTQKKINQLTWWGDVAATCEYCRVNVRRTCERYGGDPSAVFLTGFSRGAIACGYIGLHDDRIANLWIAFLPHSHHDGGSFTAEGSRERLDRVRGRASFISWGGRDGGKTNSLKGKSILEDLGFPVATLEIPNLEHSDRWMDTENGSRQAARAWLAKTIQVRPGTRTAKGRVADAAGKGLAGVKIDGGEFRWTATDESGNYELRGLLDGEQVLAASKSGLKFTPPEHRIRVKGADLVNLDFKAAP